MKRPAPVDHPVHDLIKERHSPRCFSGREVDAKTLASLFEAARWAPSSFNEQPWRFVIARREDKENFERILDLLSPGNQGWAQTARVLGISIAKKTFTRNGKPNRHALHDVGLASAMMAAQATAHGIGMHMMAGFDRERAQSELGIPEDFDPVAAFALGYPEEPENLPDSERERVEKPRTRKPLDELLFGGRWDAPFKGLP